METTTEKAFADIPEGMSAMAIMGAEGDTKTIWDPDNEVEAEAARKQFREFKSKGYLCFRTKKDGSKGEQIHEFDPRAERIIFSPPMAGG